MKVGFSGAHGTGKTTLAERVALENDFIMYYTEVSKVIKDKKLIKGDDENDEDAFYLRLLTQQHVLDHVKCQIENGETFSVYDRSMVDVCGYSEMYLTKMLRGFNANSKHLLAYSDHIKSIVESFEKIDHTFLVQPGIEFEDDADRANVETQLDLNKNLVNALLYCVPKDKYTIIPKEMVDLEERVSFCNRVLEEKISLYIER